MQPTKPIQLIKPIKPIQLFFMFLFFANLSFAAEQDLLLQAGAALQSYRQNSITIIDVRDPAAFEKLHIPGALNVPLFAVKTKSFLKAGPIVLVNEGFHLTPLETECRALREKGFNAAALIGGLVAWDAAKGPLDGDRLYLSEARMVSANVFQQEKNRSDLLVIDASKWSQVKDILSTQKPQHQPTLLYTQNGAGYENIHYGIEKVGAGPVFYLAGGMAGYKAFQNSLAMSLRPQDERMQSISACPSCKKKALD